MQWSRIVSPLLFQCLILPKYQYGANNKTTGIGPHLSQNTKKTEKSNDDTRFWSAQFKK
jgi:hypothetical protein